MKKGVVKKVADIGRLDLGDDEIAEYDERMDEIILKTLAVISRMGK